MTPLLSIDKLHAWYGKGHVLHGVDVHIGAGEIVSLLGRNGSGRSTTVKAVMGQVAASGSVRFQGEELLGMKPFQIARKGIGYVPESRDVFPTLSVEQNLQLGRPGKRPSRWQMADMFRLFPQLELRRASPAGVLSGGEQQMLALCRSLMSGPSLLLIDEPTEGLAPRIVEQLAAFLRELAAEGVSILLAEQKLAIALKISQRVYLMGRGTIVFEGSPAELQENTGLRREWLEV